MYSLIAAGAMLLDPFSPQNVRYRGGTEIPGLQLAKFFCALLVIQIHVPSGIKDYIKPILLIGVPIFLMITGYFLPDAAGVIKKDRVKRQFLKILKLFAFVGCVYLVYRIAQDLRHGESLAYLMRPRTWARMALVGDLPWGHMWYLVTLMQALVIIYLCVVFKVGKWVFLLIPIGIAINLIIGKYNPIIQDSYNVNILLSRNVVGTGLPSVLTGCLIRYYEHRLPSTRAIFTLALVFLLGCYVESYILKILQPRSWGDMFIFTLPFATAVFILFARYTVTGGVAKTLSSWGKVYSMDMYLWHPLLAYFILASLEHFDIHPTEAFDAFIIMGAALIAAMVLKYTGIKKLYS